MTLLPISANSKQFQMEIKYNKNDYAESYIHRVHA